MIQFLKPRKDRQRHLDVVESAQMPLPDVIDWLAAAAEESGLTDEEAAEIQIAFQQQSAIDVVEPDEFSLDFGLESLAAPSSPTVAETPMLLVSDPLDLSQIELPEPLCELTPAPVWSDLSRSVPPVLAIVESPPVVEPTVDELTLDELTLDEPTLVEPTLVESVPAESSVALVDADALVEIRLDTCAVAALPEVAVIPMLAAATEPEAVESVDLAIDAAPITAMIAGVINELNDIPDAGLAIDDLPEAAATPIDWQNANWASEAVDVAAVEAAEVPATPTSPLSYFQYYLDETAIGDGQAATDETPAPYVTPWRQPSMPGGLIGAGVLGATLVSGFVIADTVKTPKVTAVKRPTPPAPLQSLDPKNQAIAAVPPKVMPPESMQPEVALPQPKSATMSPPIFPPMAPIAQSSYGMSPLGSAIARSSSSDLPQSNAGLGNGLSESPTITAARRAESSPVAAGPAIGANPQRDLTSVSELPAPSISRGTPITPIRSTPPTSEMPPAAPSPTAELPELKPDTSVPQPEVIAPETIVPETPTVTRATPSVLSELTPDPVSSPLQRVDPAPVAPIADVVVPTEVAPVAPIGDQSAVLPVTPTPELPAERVFRREEATAPSTMPSVALAQPIADRTSRLPTQAQVQTLLAVPAVNAYVPMVAQWRPLTQSEASVAVNAQQLEGFTRQQLSPQDYRAAYQLVSEQTDVLPSFGFIDYQRKLIILPPEPTTASNPIEHSRSFHGAAIIAQRTTAL